MKEEDYVFVCKKCGDELDIKYEPKEQEPVAWVDKLWIDRPDVAKHLGVEKMFMRHAEGIKNYVPLYTTPQYRELSDEDILKLARSLSIKEAWITTDQTIEFANAVLKKASEK